MSLEGRLSRLINSFADRYRSHAQQGLLVQLWMPHTENDGNRVLTTQGSPFVIIGSDQLMLYRCACSRHKPSADYAHSGCPIAQVFADEPDSVLKQQHQQPPLAFDRAVEAARCGLQSTLLLPIYDAESQSPACVVELAQHEKGVDFALTTAILQDLCMAAFFWVPLLELAQLPATTCFQPLQSLVDDANTSPQRDADDGSTHAITLAAPAGALRPVVRRCSRLIVEAPDLACFYPCGDSEELLSSGSLAPPSQLEQEAWGEQQQQLGRRPRRRSRRHSLVVTDHLLAAAEANQQLEVAAATADQQQPKAGITSVHPGPLSTHLESPLEGFSSGSNALFRSCLSNAASKSTSGVQSWGGSSCSAAGPDWLQSGTNPFQRRQQPQEWHERNTWLAVSGSQGMRSPQELPRLPRQPQAARADHPGQFIEQRRCSIGSSTGSVLVLPADAQRPCVLGGSLTARQARAVRLGAVIGVGSAGRVFKATYAGQAVAVKVLPHSAKAADKVAQAAASLLGISHPNIVGLQDFVTMMGTIGQAPEPASPHISQGRESLGPLIILRDDSSGQLTQSSGGSLSSLTGAPAAETWLVQDYCDAGTLEQLLLARGGGGCCAGPNWRFLLHILVGVARGMQELSSRGVVHGNLRARNIILATAAEPAEPSTPPGCPQHAALDAVPRLVPRIADAGLFRALPDLSGACGSAAHQAPELLLGRQPSTASDVFAFGVLMWEVAMAQQPWQGIPSAGVMQLVALRGARLQFSQEVPQDFQQIAVACWANDPQARPKTFRKLQEYLQELVRTTAA